MREKVQKFKTKHAHHVRRAKRVVRKPWFAIPTATFSLFIIASAVGIFLFNGGTPTLRSTDNHVVILNYDKQEQTVPTNARTVGALLVRLEVKLHDGDIVEPAADTEIVGDNFRVNVYRAVPVTIIDGGKKTFTYSAAATPRSIVKRAGVEVFPEDHLDLLPTDNFLTESSIGERVVIERATPVNLNLYGTPVTLRTHAKTVGDLIDEKKIKLGKDDTLQPVAATKLATNTQIFIVHKGVQIITEEQQIAMPVETIDDASLSFGVNAVRQQGSPGKKLVTYQIETQNGAETGRKVIQEVVAAEPVKQVVARGSYFNIAADKTAVMAAAGIAKSDYTYVDYIISRESGWCHTKWQGEYGGCPAYHGTPTSAGTGYGLCQATPGYKMASAGSDWGPNPITQMKWCNGYAKSRHGGWAGAYNYWQSHHHW